MSFQRVPDRVSQAEGAEEGGSQAEGYAERERGEVGSKAGGESDSNLLQF